MVHKNKLTEKIVGLGLEICWDSWLKLMNASVSNSWLKLMNASVSNS